MDIFAGAGGLSLGLKKAGFEILSHIEISDSACKTLRANGFSSVINKEISSFNYAPFVGKVDFLAGGPPCQPFSTGGSHGAHTDNRDLFPEAIRAVRELNPKAFLFENVRGLLRNKFSNYLEYVRLQLSHPKLDLKPNETWIEHLARLEKAETKSDHSEIEYSVFVHSVNAADYGVPQKRNRVFIVGFRRDLGAEWAFPPASHSYERLIWDIYKSNEYLNRHGIELKNIRHSDKERKLAVSFENEAPLLSPWVTIRDAVRGLPNPESELSREFQAHKFIKGARTYKGHTGSVLDLPSKTIKAGVNGVPGGENMFIDDNRDVRYFTVRESARLQQFPDEYEFNHSRTESMRQIGNAVPVFLAKIIGLSIFDALNFSD